MKPHSDSQLERLRGCVMARGILITSQELAADVRVPPQVECGEAVGGLYQFEKKAKYILN